MTPVFIRPVRAADCAALTGLHEASFADFWRREAMADLLETPGTFAFAGEDETGMRGFIMARAAGGEAEILTLAVHPSARRRGLAKHLVQAAAAEAARLGAKALFLEVAIDNTPALGLYTALGFSRAGARKAYYARAGAGAADALVLKADLPLSA